VAAARRLGVPHLVEVNARLREEAARYRHLEESAAAARLERTVLTQATVVFAVSSVLAEYSERRGAQRVEVLPNAVAVERLPRHPRSDGAVKAIFTGTLRPWHGVECIAAAWQLLGSAAPQLVVVGDGPGRSLLEAAGAHVIGAVAHGEVPKWLADAQIGLAPYAPDAPDYFCPLKVFEYLGAGLAAVVGDLPALIELLEPRSAVVIPRGNSVALAEAVAFLARDRQAREQMGRAGRALVEARHTWQRRAERVLAVAAETRSTLVA